MSGPTFGNYYATPDLVAHYDEDQAARSDLAFYLDLAQALRADTVVDLGAGTGRLCSLLASRGHRVIGVEPEPVMLTLARAQPHAAVVTWILGTADDLPDACADLVVMTGHVAQYFLDQASWVHVLTHVRRSLRPAGRLAFEVRNAAVEEWRSWADDAPHDLGWGTVRSEVSRRGDLVTHVDHWTRGERQWATSETLRFPSWRDLVAGLQVARLAVLDGWGDWDGRPISDNCPEWILLVAAEQECYRGPAGPMRDREGP